MNTYVTPITFVGTVLLLGAVYVLWSALSAKLTRKPLTGRCQAVALAVFAFAIATRELGFGWIA